MEESKTKLYKALSILAIVIVVLVVVKIAAEIKGYRYIGGGVSASNTISVSGQAEVYGSPDIARISFEVRKEAVRAAEAQTQVNEGVASALSAVRALGIEEKDIKTQNYSSYPKYEYRAAPPVANPSGGVYYPTPGRQVLIGYEASQSVVVTVRNLDNVNALLQALGTADVTNLQGPNFAIDDEDGLKAEARKEAINKARAKAKVLAGDLGVSLVRVVSFSEDGYYPYPAYRTMTAGVAFDSMTVESAPELPMGQETISSNVTITYEIR